MVLKILNEYWLKNVAFVKEQIKQTLVFCLSRYSKVENNLYFYENFKSTHVYGLDMSVTSIKINLLNLIGFIRHTRQIK